MSDGSRRDVAFQAGHEQCRGWLYPAAADGAPCVVLAHGFGSTKEARLDAYAERFQSAGLNALAFDYRHFGASDGEPRQLLDIRTQLIDWAAAVAFARDLDGVDPNRVAAWGSSLGGGHVIGVAARDQRVRAAVAQVPHASGRASAAAGGARAAARLTAAGLVDAARSALSGRPYYVPIVGPPGTRAAMTTPDSEPGYSALYPAGFEWRNEVAARVFLTLAAYSPGRAARRVSCPLLVQVATHDVVTPPQPARRAARSAPHGELVEYPLSHFEIYVGEPFEQAVADQVDFLWRHLGT